MSQREKDNKGSDFVQFLTPDWDQYMDRYDDHDTPQTDDEIIERLVLKDFIELACEAFTEADDTWHLRLRELYRQEDKLAMGEALHQCITDYGRSVADHRGMLNE